MTIAAARPVPALLPRLDPTVAVLIRRAGDIQVGSSPERARLVRPSNPVATAALARLLSKLDGLQTLAELQPLATEAGLTEGELATLLRELGEVGLVHWVPPAGRTPFPRVVLHGRGPVGDALAEGLRAAGTILRRSCGRTLDPGASEVNLVVLCDDQVVDPCLLADLVSTRTPHLVVRLRDGTGLVGPLVLPGRSSCVRCADLHRSELDPEWPALAAQLLGRTTYGSPALVRATAAVALGQLEHLLRGGIGGEAAPGSLGATLELNLRTSTLQRRPWPPHPRCGCGAHP